MTTINDLYTRLYNQTGLLVSINRSADGASLIFYPETKTFDETHFLTVELRQNEILYGTLDLSDLVVEPPRGKKKIRTNLLTASDRLIESDRFPADINYNTELVIGLTTETIDYFGLRVAQVFYQSIDPVTKNQITPVPIVFERYYYNWDSSTNLPLDRLKEIKFYWDDGELTEESKLLPKDFYNVSDRASIVLKRRTAIVSWLVARATELGLQQEIEQYFSQYKEQTDRYILYGKDQIIQMVHNNNSDSWLDTDTTTTMGTIREAIVLSLAKALEATPNTEVDSYLASLGY